ncbi:MAG: penicillin-binding protein activator LpoB [Planctomycetaceae bacterium]|nr:penicillin-binding protein activator LpoB [Planctomycetaceae bacterium]
MDRRYFLASALTALAASCRSQPTAAVRTPGQPDMVGSQSAGAETFKPLVAQAMTELLARHCTQVIPAGVNTLPAPPKRICFMGVENRSAEEIGDFKDQIYQCIDLHLVQSQTFQPVNKRYVDAGLMQLRMRPDQVFIPQNMRMFTATMEQQGQPFDYVLIATITSGTTREGKEYQRDYLLTMELTDIRTGQYDKQAATLSKGYYHSHLAKLGNAMGWKR